MPCRNDIVNNDYNSLFVGTQNAIIAIKTKFLHLIIIGNNLLWKNDVENIKWVIVVDIKL